MSEWRVMGMWHDNRQFLVVMGQTKAECLERLDAALAEYTYDDFEAMEPLWFEVWRPATRWRAGEWYPESLVPLRRFKLLRAAGKSAVQAPLRIRGVVPETCLAG